MNTADRDYLIDVLTRTLNVCKDAGSALTNKGNAEVNCYYAIGYSVVTLNDALRVLEANRESV